MNSSIRQYLLIHLLFGITIITALSTVVNYYLDEKAIGIHLDHWLIQASFTFEAILGNDLPDRNTKQLQQLIDQITYKVEQHSPHIKTKTSDYHFQDKLQFQVWDHQGKLLLHSKNAPAIPMSNGKSGFSDRLIDNQPWRIFTLRNQQTGLMIVTAERLDIRQALGHKIARDAVYILLLSYPILGLLIWFIAGRGLGTIKSVAQEVANRKANFLDAVDVKMVPREIKPLVDELNKLLLRLQQAFEREKAFSANAAHELRTPLAALKTQAQVAIKATNESERDAALRKLITGVNRSTHVVQQLLTLSRLMPDAVLNDATLINLTRITTEVIADLAPLAIDSNIDIELIGADKPIIMKGVPTALSILIRNLVDNAIRYTKADGAIQVKLYEYDDVIELAVIDNGPGIPAELRSQVFERFYRILGTKSIGSGLGLAIVQQISHLHQANLTLGKPEAHNGLEVKITFPKDAI